MVRNLINPYHRILDAKNVIIFIKFAKLISWWNNLSLYITLQLLTTGMVSYALLAMYFPTEPVFLPLMITIESR
jgi:hypothetical protein